MKGTMEEGITMKAGDQNKGYGIQRTLYHSKEKDLRSEEICETLAGKGQSKLDLGQ